jgi:flagellar basal body-associated protein FliL
MKKFKSDEQKEKEFKRRTGIVIVIATIIIVSLVYNVIFPMMLIGMIWDYDIRSQLQYQNQDGVEKNADVVKFRLTYENNDETDLRVERAINVYINLFDPESQWIVEKTENTTLLEFSWNTDYGN